jgi:SAM-dependent methyltransferase
VSSHRPHHHESDHPPSHSRDTGQPTSTDPTDFWEEFYGSGRRPWSGRPNALLVDELAAHPLVPGTVLDLGSGSGGDAVWFAGLGWTVTAVDISAAALAVGAEAARKAGVAGRVTWTRCDLDADFPAGRWDLVVASYLQSPVALDRDRVLRRAAEAVAPGGTLVVLGHERFPASHQGPHTELPTTAEVLAALDLTGWTVERAEPVAFTMTSADGGHGERFDSVIRLRRSSTERAGAR